jgi:phosphopantetheinyl transferase (holo-ACP synthase)
MQVKDIVWNKEIEDILKNNQIKCTKYSILHKQESEKYYRYHNYLFFTNSVITSISSMSIITSNSLFTNIQSDTINIINIIFGGLIVFSTALSSFQHITNYIDLSNQHKNASIKYKCLSANMSILLALEAKSKSIESFTWANDEFTKLENDSPIISDSLNYTTSLSELESKEITIKNEINEINEINETNEIKVILPKNSMTEFVAQRWAMNSLE